MRATQVSALWTRRLGCVVAAASMLAAASASAQTTGAVFTATNGVDGNDVLMYLRDTDGRLTFADDFPTGGKGTGGGLGNQGGLLLSSNNKWLFAVNAGSGELSAFRVRRDHLSLTDIISTGGQTPVSVTEYDGTVYVLDGAGGGHISGFRVDDAGNLSAIENSMQTLSGADVTGPAQIQFSADGRVLVVTEKATNLIDTFLVDDNGLAGAAMVHESNGATPFGFDINRKNVLIVSEAFGGAPDASAVSTYKISQDGSLKLSAGSVATTETAACWIVSAKSDRFTYTTNTGSGSVSGYGINRRSGVLELLDENGVTGMVGEGTGPIDAAVSRDGRFMYVLSGRTGEIVSFEVNEKDGSLTNLERTDGLPAGTNGLIVR